MPTVAIVGRPNVGKSALFNRLAKRKIVIVHDQPGVTRDRLAAPCLATAVPCTIVDTGGIGATLDDGFAAQVTLEADIAAPDSDVDRTVPLEIRPGTQSGEQLTLRGRGVPRLRSVGRGDVVATIVVETPTKLDSEQADLLRQLAAARGEENPVASVEKSHKGVFGRFKDAFR